jgi:hypothetical protein
VELVSRRQRVDTVKIARAGPLLSATATGGLAGVTLTGTLSFSDTRSSSRAITISGVPAGPGITMSGTGILVSWNAPVTGARRLTVAARNGRALTAILAESVTSTAH